MTFPLSGAEFPNDLQRHLDICRATAHSLLELLLSPTIVYPPLLIPQNSLLRRAAIDLLGRGFVLWQVSLKNVFSFNTSKILF